MVWALILFWIVFSLEGAYLAWRLDKLEARVIFIDGNSFRDGVRLELCETFLGQSKLLEPDRKSFAAMKWSDYELMDQWREFNASFEAMIAEKRRLLNFDYRQWDEAQPDPFVHHKKNIPTGSYRIEQEIIEKLRAIKKEHPDMLPDGIVDWPQFTVDPQSFLAWYIPPTIRLFMNHDRPIPVALKELAAQINIDISSIRPNKDTAHCYSGKAGPHSVGGVRRGMLAPSWDERPSADEVAARSKRLHPS